jgi:hypothetical protein
VVGPIKARRQAFQVLLFTCTNGKIIPGTDKQARIT